MNDNENIYKNDMQAVRAKRFAINKIGQYFGLSYKEFIELPHATCDLLFEISEELISAEAPIIKKLADEFSG